MNHPALPASILAVLLLSLTLCAVPVSAQTSVQIVPVADGVTHPLGQSAHLAFWVFDAGVPTNATEFSAFVWILDGEDVEDVDITGSFSPTEPGHYEADVVLQPSWALSGVFVEIDLDASIGDDSDSETMMVEVEQQWNIEPQVLGLYQVGILVVPGQVVPITVKTRVGDQLDDPTAVDLEVSVTSWSGSGSDPPTWEVALRKASTGTYEGTFTVPTDLGRGMSLGLDVTLTVPGGTVTESFAAMLTIEYATIWEHIVTLEMDHIVADLYAVDGNGDPLQGTFNLSIDDVDPQGPVSFVEQTDADGSVTVDVVPLFGTIEILGNFTCYALSQIVSTSLFASFGDFFPPSLEVSTDHDGTPYGDAEHVDEVTTVSEEGELLDNQLVYYAVLAADEVIANGSGLTDGAGRMTITFDVPAGSTDLTKHYWTGVPPTGAWDSVDTDDGLEYLSATVGSNFGPGGMAMDEQVEITGSLHRGGLSELQVAIPSNPNGEPILAILFDGGFDSFQEATMAFIDMEGRWVPLNALFTQFSSPPSAGTSATWHFPLPAVFPAGHEFTALGGTPSRINLKVLTMGSSEGSGAPLRVIHTVPIHAAINVSALDPIEITFNQPLAPSVTEVGSLAVEALGDVAVEGTLSLGSDPRSLVFTPALATAPWQTTVSVTVLAGIAAVSGGTLADDYTFTYSTGENPDPAPVVRTNAPTKASVPEDSVTHLPFGTKDIFSDPKGQPLEVTMELVGLNPPTVTGVEAVRDAAGSVIVTTGDNYNGNGTLHFVASDGTNAPISHDVALRIDPVNDLPLFTLLNGTAPTEGMEIAILEDAAMDVQVAVTDVDGDHMDLQQLDLSLSWLTIEEVSAGTFSLRGTPTNDQVGRHEVQLELNDGTGTSRLNVALIVLNTNDAPTATIDAPEDGLALGFGEAFDLDGSSSSDVDANDTLTYLWESDKVGTLGTNATLSGVKLKSAGTHTITLTVTDGSGEVSTAQITVEVAKPPEGGWTIPGPSAVAFIAALSVALLLARGKARRA